MIVACSLFSEETIQDKSNNTLPLIDISLNTGLIWYGQAKVCVNLFEKLYIKVHTSTTTGSSENGINVGYQFKFNENQRLQTGLGYSYFEDVVHVLFSFGVESKEYFHGVIAEVDYIHYLYSGPIKIGFNAGINVLFFMDEYERFMPPSIEFGDRSVLNTFPSLNFGITVGIL